jgi:interleukin-1 receptor-associated kinase 1
MTKNLFSTKVDVFSFGVVLFELATGFKAYDKTKKNPFLYDQMAKVDESSIECVKNVIDMSTPNDLACFNLCKLLLTLGKKCCDHNPNYRPSMESVLKGLELFQPLINF